MKKITIVLICLLQGLKMQGQIVEALKNIGMENIRCAQTAGTTTLCFENNAYRSTYTGIGQALEACLKTPIKDTLQLVVLADGVPQLCITLPHTLTEAYQQHTISLAQLYQQMGISVDTDEAMEALQTSHPEVASSAWKMDLVIYPELYLENNTFDELYTYAINLNPALEMDLWRGGKAIAQAVLPIATNLRGEMNRVRPGILALSQEIRWKHNFFGKLTVGHFTNNRIGAQLEMKYHTHNGRMQWAATVGSTGFSAIIPQEGWYIGTRQRFHAALMASLYEPATHLQFDLKVSRYVYGDLGLRGDCTRHLGEYAIGLYALYTGGEVNGGFHFAIPLPGKKWSRKGFVRVKPADYFAWAYSMASDGPYVEQKMGRNYQVAPNENRSSQFYQPHYLRYFLLKDKNTGSLLPKHREFCRETPAIEGEKSRSLGSKPQAKEAGISLN